MDWPPHMIGPGARRGNILNVYTQPGSRRQGIARRLMEVALDWCRGNGIRAVILHASEDGRALYEKLGFQPTNEMRLLLSRSGHESDPVPRPTVQEVRCGRPRPRGRGSVAQRTRGGLARPALALHYDLHRFRNRRVIGAFRGERVARGLGRLDLEASAHRGPHAFRRRIEADRRGIHHAVAQQHFLTSADLASRDV